MKKNVISRNAHFICFCQIQPTVTCMTCSSNDINGLQSWHMVEYVWVWKWCMTWFYILSRLLHNLCNVIQKYLSTTRSSFYDFNKVVFSNSEYKPLMLHKNYKMDYIKKLHFLMIVNIAIVEMKIEKIEMIKRINYHNFHLLKLNEFSM